MTFALKDFDTIKKHFNDTIKLLLIREKKDSINELPKKRKEEVLFLKSILTELETRFRANPRDVNLYTEIFYGAMLVISQDIVANLGHLEKRENSLLFSRLKDGMGIIDPKTPDQHQSYRYYQSLNNFLKLLYKDEDSRNGLKSTHALDSVPLDKLVTLVATSYRLEEAAYNTIANSLKSIGKSDIHSNSHTVIKEIPATALSQFTTWDALKASLDALILNELADKNVSKVTALSTARSAQILSLQIVADTLIVTRLTAIKAPERIAILAGMMLLVREQIGLEYGKAPFSKDDISASVVHTGLTGLLTAKDISSENAEALITAAHRFISHMAIEHTEPRGVVTETLRIRNMFSGVIGLNLPTMLDTMQKSVLTCRIEALNRCVIELEATMPREPTPSFSSYLSLSGWLGKKPVTTARTGVDEEKAEENESKEEKKERKLVV